MPGKTPSCSTGLACEFRIDEKSSTLTKVIFNEINMAKDPYSFLLFGYTLAMAPGSTEAEKLGAQKYAFNERN